MNMLRKTFENELSVHGRLNTVTLPSEHLSSLTLTVPHALQAGTNACM